MMPSTMPPTNAPGTLPRPPMTQTTNALPRTWPVRLVVTGYTIANTAPVAPAISAPMPNVTA